MSFPCHIFNYLENVLINLCSPSPPLSPTHLPSRNTSDIYSLSLMQVKDIQLKNLQDRFLKKHVIATLKSEHLPDDVTFRCRKCNVEACQAHDIRTVKESHHVVINRDFENSKVKPSPNLKTLSKRETIPQL